MPESNTVDQGGGGPSEKSVSIVQLGILCGLLSGGVDASFWFVRSVIQEKWMPFGEMIFWSGPASQAVLLGLTAIPLALLAKTRPSCRRFACGALIFLACLYVSLLLPIHLAAGVILSAGIAVQLSRLFLTSRLVKPVRWATMLLSIAVGCIFFNHKIYPDIREQRTVSDRVAATANSPNVLLVVLDTVSDEYLNLAKLPNLEETMTRGVRFSNAYSTSPWTLPSHVSMFTGIWRHEMDSNLFLDKWDANSDTLAEWLQQHGYHTGGFVGNTYYCSASTRLNRGFDHYEDFIVSLGSLAKHNKFFDRVNNSSLSVRMGLFDRFGRRNASSVNSQFLNWYDKNGEDRPFFAFLNYFDAHDPYVPPKEYRNPELKTLDNRKLMRFWWNRRKDSLTDDDIDVAKRAYMDCMRYLDDEWGKLTKGLEERGLLENTIIIITGDHGEHFGEHGVFGHANSLYEQLVHVPFAISWGDKIPKNTKNGSYVSMRDIAATIVDLAKLSDGCPLPGRSMRPLWAGDVDSFQAEPIWTGVLNYAPAQPNHGTSPAATSPLHSVVFDGWKLIVNSEGKEELFNLAEDPLENTNLADDQSALAELERLRALMPNAAP